MIDCLAKKTVQTFFDKVGALLHHNYVKIFFLEILRRVSALAKFKKRPLFE